MDRFVPLVEHLIEMTRHLRPVPDSGDGAAYVIGRSSHVRPGTPYVIARCVDRVVASIFALAGQEVMTRDEMLRDASLKEALEAWEAGDDSVFVKERKARTAFARPAQTELAREVRWHPSRTGGVQT
jgi:hypothetical protein